ncbi:prepilin-type N-terminal cleavage/methylation domain-containing protein, partial [bacterium]|nr:prepilin-type N-terminal cleavage/methylation domain-containing protein [bacterium]
MSMKKYGFTLGEVLITLSVVSLVAILTIPTFLGDLAAKGRMARLTSTIGDLNNAVQLYMIKNRLNALDENFKFNDFLETKDQLPSRYY